MKRLCFVLGVAAAVAVVWCAPARALEAGVPETTKLRPILGQVTDLLTFQIHTVYRQPSGDPVERTQDALLFVPALVDADGNTLPDLLVQMTIDAGRATLRVTPMLAAPSPYPLLIEGILTDPRRSSDLKVAFGYDATAATAPAAFDATIGLLGAGRVTSFGVDLHTAGAGESLGLIAEVFTAGPDGERLDPQRGRIDYTPVPAAAHFGVVQGSDLGVQQSSLDLVTDTPTKAEVLIQDIQGSSETRATGVIDKVPNTLSLVLTDTSSGQKTWDYRATARVDEIFLRIAELRSGSVDEDFVVHLQDMATSATLVQDTPTHSTFTASQPIGVIEAGVAEGGNVAWLPEPAYLYNTDRGVNSSAFRILGLQRAELGTGDPLLVDVTLQPGPFRVVFEDGSRTFDGWIRDLPSQVRVEFSAIEETLDFTGSAPIGEITLNVDDPAGVTGGSGGEPPIHGVGGSHFDSGGPPEQTGRATHLELALRDLPTNLSFSFQSQGTAGVDAHGDRIGSVDLLATSGPRIVVDPGFDGVAVEDVPSHYAIAVHLTGLRLATLSTGDPPYTAALDTDGGPFLVRLAQDDRLTRVVIRDLPSSLRATLDPERSLSYTASAPIAEITAEITDPGGIGGRATRALAELRSLPDSLDITYGAAAGAVGIDARGKTIGSIDVLLTSGPELTVDPGFDGLVGEDVPSHYALAVHLGGLKLARVTTGAPPYTLTLDKEPGPFLVRLAEGARTTLVKVLDLPQSLQATFNPAGSVAYTASAPISEISAELTDPAGVAGRATRATALLRDVPTNLDLSWNSISGAITADARGSTVGLLEVMLTSTAPPAFSGDGVLLHDLADRYQVFGRITGLRRVAFAQGPPPSFALDTTGGRVFTVDVRQAKPGGVATTSATINALPASVAVSFTSPTTFTYTASSAVSQINLDAYDPSGISGRATALHGLLQGLPTRLDVSWAADGTITLDAAGGTVGLIEFQLTSGPDDRLSPSVDGLLQRDLSDRYVVFARLTGLRRAVARQEPAPDIDLQTTGGRILQVDLSRLDGSKVEYTRATLDRLVSSVRVRLVDGAFGQEIFYDASAPTNSIVFDTNSGDRWNLNASMANPLPASVYICQSGNGFCTGFARSAGAGAVRFVASEHTTINMFDCTRPLNSSCVRGGSPQQYIQIDNLRVRVLEQDADASGSGESGYIFVNTSGHTMSGSVFIEEGSIGFRANFGGGFWAQNRRGSWSVWGLFKSKSGSVNCAGTSLDIRIIGIWIGVTSYLC